MVKRENIGVILLENCTEYIYKLQKSVQFQRLEADMYRAKDRKTPALFPELFPPGGGLNTGNRWLKLAAIAPWDKLEEVYSGYFPSGMGWPAKDSRLICVGPGPVAMNLATALRKLEAKAVA